MRSIEAKNRAVDLLKLKHELTLQLASAQDWDELTDLIVRFPSSITHIQVTDLIMPDQNTSGFELVTEWKSDGDTSTHMKIPATSEFCRDCVLIRPNSLQPLSECKLYKISTSSEAVDGYCLPLTYGEKLVANLRFILEPGDVLTDSQTEIFNNIGAEQAIAIIAAHQQHALVELRAVEAAADERQVVSRDLHDTLGQNLAYLRLKLDQLAVDDSLQDISDIKPDLVRLRDIANESYLLVRGTLAELKNGEHTRFI